MTIQFKKPNARRKIQAKSSRIHAGRKHHDLADTVFEGTLHFGINKAGADSKVLTTSFDARHVDVIAILRPTESNSLYQQILGRGLRLSKDKKDCYILDYTGMGHDIPNWPLSFQNLRM